jgi:hypothetical protein
VQGIAYHTSSTITLDLDIAYTELSPMLLLVVSGGDYGIFGLPKMPHNHLTHTSIHPCILVISLQTLKKGGNCEGIRNGKTHLLIEWMVTEASELIALASTSSIFEESGYSR